MDVVVKSGTYPNIAYEPYGWAGKEGNARLDSEMADRADEDAHDGWRIDAPRDVVRGWVDSLKAERDGLKARVKLQQSQIDASHFAFKAVNEEYDKLDRKCDELKAERDALRCENERLRQVVRVQADSFARLEAELAEARKEQRGVTASE